MDVIGLKVSNVFLGENSQMGNLNTPHAEVANVIIGQLFISKACEILIDFACTASIHTLPGLSTFSSFLRR